MPTPDLSPYVNLTLYDKSEQDIYDAAVLSLQTNMPDWIPREGQTEVLLLEALAQEVSEAVFAINRLPGSITSILLQLFGIFADPGTAPTATVTFTLADTDGDTIPKGTKLLLALDGGLQPIIFTTDDDLVVASGSATGTIGITGTQATDLANGMEIGTDLQVIDSSLTSVDSIVLATEIAGGVDPELTIDWLNRAIQHLARLSDTLVTPAQFQAALLERPEVVRAMTIDNYDPTKNILSADDADFEGSLGTWGAGINWAVAQDTTHALRGTHSMKCTRANATPGNGYAANGGQGYLIDAGATYTAFASVYGDATTDGKVFTFSLHWLDPAGATLSQVDQNVTVVSGSWTNVSVVGQVAPDDAVYAKLFITDDPQAAPDSGQAIWVDEADLKLGTDTTFDVGGISQVTGNDGGHITLVAYGENVALTANQKAAILSDFAPQAETNLAIHIIDPSITVQDIAVTVVGVAGSVMADVQAQVTAAIQAYLDPDAWDWGTTIYLNELIALVSNCDLVDRVVDFTTPNADVALTGIAPLVDAGTITVTVQ